MAVTSKDLRALSNLDLDIVRNQADALIKFRTERVRNLYSDLIAVAQENYQSDESDEPGYLRGTAELIAGMVFKDHSIPLYELITADIMGTL